MGVTVDLIPLLPGETPEQAIARVYEGGISLSWDDDDETVRIDQIEDADPAAEPVASSVLDDWRAEVIRRLHDLHEWQSEEHRGHLHLWSAHFGWQVELNDDDITLRARRELIPPYLDDEVFLAAFEGLHTILHSGDQYGLYRGLDDPDDRPSIIG